jgi:hypothetical protein
MKRLLLKSQRHVFWEALVIAVFIFGAGVLLGVFLENSRIGEISDLYLQSEINLLDVKVQTEILDMEDLNCPQAIKKNLEFGDKVFEDAKLLQRYEDANRITSSIIEQHKKYDLLRVLFWINSIKIKEKCSGDYHTVVYLYDYNPEDLKEASKQAIFSRLLEEIKEDKGDEVVLIPIARNLNLASLDILASNFDVNQTSIILDEDLVVDNIGELYQVRFALNMAELEK